MTEILPCYVGYDSREDEAFKVCENSLKRHSSIPVFTMAMRQEVLRYIGLYTRKVDYDDGQSVDVVDGKPFSTEFSFSRFLVPALAQYEGWALFCDCDMLFRTDVAELLALRDEKYAVMVVKHDHRPKEQVKMDGERQEHYFRKNWSSFILWNCSHPSNARLTVEMANTKPGGWLHAFQWLKPHEIGELPEAWNWLEGSSPSEIHPKVVHFTRGGPWFEEYEQVAYAREWLAEQKLLASRVDLMRPTTVLRFTGGNVAR